MKNPTHDALARLSEHDRAHGGTGSDYSVSKLLGTGKTTVSRWRVGHGQMDDDLAMRAAEVLGEDAAVLLAEIHAARSNSDSARKQWTRIVKMLKAEHAAA